MNKGLYGISKNRTYDTKYHVLVESASYAISSSYAISASYTISSSYAVTASYALNSGTNPTTGYIPYNNSYVFTDSNIYFDGTNVGIGTVSPVSKLHVSGTTTITGDWNGNTTNGLHLSFRNGLTGSIYSIQNGTSWRRLVIAGDPIVLNSPDLGNNANVGIGMNNPTNRLDVSGSVRATSFTGSFSGSVFGYVPNEATTSFVVSSQTSSFVQNTQTGSMLSPYTLNSQTSSFIVSSQTGSFVTNSQTSSFIVSSQTGSFVQNSQTSSFITNSQTSSFVTNSQTGSFVVNTQLNSYLTTGSTGTTQTISGSLIVNQNLTIIGSQSIQYITSSQLNIATNIISVNTATPSIRFGGLAVYDSGSTGTGLTGSLLWDSQNDNWVYSNPSGSNYDGAVFLVGPRNTSGLGNEVYIKEGYAAVGDGGHHMTSSVIYSGNSLIRLETNTQITGGLIVSNGITGSFSGSVVGYVASSETSSFVISSQTSSFVQNTQTGSMLSVYTLNSQTSSFVQNTQTGSMLSPYTLNSQTSSFVTNDQTSSFLQNTQTGSMLSAYTLNSQTASFASTASNTFTGAQVAKSGVSGFTHATTDYAAGSAGTIIYTSLGSATGNTYGTISVRTSGGSSATADLILNKNGSGKVAIGTSKTSANATLDVLGNILTTGSIYVSASNNIGLGTTSPVSPVHISSSVSPLMTVECSDPAAYSNIRFTGTGKRYTIGVGNSSETNFNVANDFFVYDDSPGVGVVRMVIDTNGNVGIGNTAPSTTLDVNGTIKATLVTASLQTNAGTVSTPPILVTTGTNLTSSIAGAIEYDGTTFYMTPSGSNRSVNVAEHFVCRTGTKTMTSNTNLQAIFDNANSGTGGLTNGALGLPGATTYYFECSINVSSMSATSGNMGFSILGAGTATFTSAAWHAVGMDATAQTTAAAQGGIWSSNTAQTGNIVTATTGTACSVIIKGIFRINAGGTIIPSIQLTTAATAVIGVNSWFKCYPIGTNNVISVGNWS